MCLRCLQLVSDPSRYRILRLLAARPRRVGELAARLGIAQPTASYHLRRLAEGGLVRMTKRGHEHYYALVTGKHFPSLGHCLGR